MYFAWEETDIETCIAYQRQALDIWRELLIHP
jgi:hypothetical protein